MRIWLLEPFYGGSHRAWCDGLMRSSVHQWRLFQRPARHWKWRMQGAAISLAEDVIAADGRPDLLVASDMLDCATFLGLARRRLGDVPLALYFHENQLSYPWSPTDPDRGSGRDLHYGFINYRSALAADRLFFNSTYHRDSFFEALRALLHRMPDDRGLSSLDRLTTRTAVLPLGLDLRRFDGQREADTRHWRRPRILWNHRWEYDKDPEAFADLLGTLAEQGCEFDLVLCGPRFARIPPALERIRRDFGPQILHDGRLERFEDYARWLTSCDLLPVTSRQDFFGISVAEAVYCGVTPLLPNRLAYPEIYDPLRRPELFYRDFDELNERLASLIRAWHRPTSAAPLASLLLEYDWSRIAPRYDELFRSIADAAPDGT
ncbi:MAG: DUF3524 domain-containing protein [Myxococcales bacterium]|nr:DUF3524 domain-containing protein [Myxococcales bacterium]